MGFEPTRQLLDRLPDFESGSFNQLRHLSALAPRRESYIITNAGPEKSP
ncbi:protein of unknown function [Candidatus Hydrogenisulfobacillus filiaventi]|uniref:Uncharacterized protein n=1 Tax=Candidatus Hydrogenisulfobacillus filiaventi TaxID=2707344 RepID=A0A6F8ZKH1_9FIRM|nr:protein of unknown function [Candidatus Hydrogenisulfobacillus filiaventi]